jgi:outer membrane protein TolC
MPLFLAILAMAAMEAGLHAQSAGPQPAFFSNSVLAHSSTDASLKLSLDDAIALGLKDNLGLTLAEDEEKSLQGQKNQVLQQFLPTITLNGDLGVHQQNLAALGFGPDFVRRLGNKIPPGISFITRDDLTDGRIQLDQMLFSGPLFAALKAVHAAENAAHFARTSTREEVVQRVASSYLRAVAAASEVDNARALEAADQLLYSHARAAHEAGTIANLDELRARVQLQAQQQALLAAQNSLEKSLIQLKRYIALELGQPITLTDPTPFSDLAAQSPEEVCAIAYRNRPDYQQLQNQAVELKAVRSAYRSQRLPSLSVGGNYSVSAVNDAGTHGNFVAQGTLSVPLFREARLRGDVDTAQAQLAAVDAQLADLRGEIEQQVRTALLDVDANSKLVEVARSNLELATRTVADETDRVNAGVDDNLPLVTAQATLAAAQSNLVESLYQYNLSKLALARASGIIEQQYRVYLGR